MSSDSETRPWLVVTGACAAGGLVSVVRPKAAKHFLALSCLFFRSETSFTETVLIVRF